VTRLLDGRYEIQIPAEAGNFSLLQKVKTNCGAHPASYSMGTRDCFTGVKHLGHEADRSPPSSAKVKNVCLCDMCGGGGAVPLPFCNFHCITVFLTLILCAGFCVLFLTLCTVLRCTSW
jgi:hypothetical protein